MTYENRRVLDAPPLGPPPEPAYRVRQPVFCLALIAACAGVFLLSPPELQGSAVFPDLTGKLMLFGPAVRAGELWRVLTAVLVHGGILHIGLNMLVVWQLGFGLERVIGTARMVVVSLAGALGAGAATLWLSFNQPTVGASGMILCWAGVMLPIMNRAGRRSIGSWLVQVAILSFLPHISWQGHLGGFLAGLPCGLALRLGPRRFWMAMPFILFGLAVLTVLVAR